MPAAGAENSAAPGAAGERDGGAGADERCGARHRVQHPEGDAERPGGAEQQNEGSDEPVVNAIQPARAPAETVPPAGLAALEPDPDGDNERLQGQGC